MADLKNFDKVIGLLRSRAAKATKDSNVSVTVGYTANYVLFVHENIEMKHAGQPRPSGLGVYWGPHGQPKFLEEPARRLSSELANIIKLNLKQGRTMAQSLLVAGLRLQRESMMLVPVEYGNLKNSAFTRLEVPAKK